MSVTFSREPLTHELLSEALPLLSAHWHEIAQHSDIPLEVDVDAYLAVEASGAARCYVARIPRIVCYGTFDVGGTTKQEGTDLVGYAVYFVRSHLHYKQSVQAVQDVIYLSPDMRGGMGAEFIAWCDEQLRADGVQVVHHHQKNAHPQLGVVLDRIGYLAVETVWSRRLDWPRGGHTPAAAGLRAQHADGATDDATGSDSDLAAFSELMLVRGH